MNIDQEVYTRSAFIRLQKTHIDRRIDKAYKNLRDLARQESDLQSSCSHPLAYSRDDDVFPERWRHCKLCGKATLK